ncbi:MAG: glutamate-1-semialdehyde 2,1-aminomutase [Parachlamydia sp.]|nr:glutamate-1-semialdehyde 2,1-aminomutase [Parachlamydia sp.]
MHEKTKTQVTYEKLCEVIPGGVNSPIRSCRAVGQLPLIPERGIGDLVYDIDGNCFIDYCGSWGPLIHGHADPEILEAVQRKMMLGTTFGMTTAVEEQLARAIITLVPSVEKIRFVSSGTEATMSAARLARGFTGKSIIVKFTGHFHGHNDIFLIKAGSGVTGLNATSTSAGIPDEILRHTACLPFNDLNQTRAYLQAHRDSIAAVILEPVACNMGVVPTQPALMKMLREETEKMGALLIFDEVITGFRLGLRGAQGIYAEKPDLTCFGKIIGGGFPAAAFGGRREIMDHLAPIGKVYQSGTLSGNPVAMEAGLTALKKLERRGFYEELEAKANIITEPVREWLNAHEQIPVGLQQVGSLFTLFFGRRSVQSMEEGQSLDLEGFARFFRYLFSHGVYAPPLQYEAWFVSMAHEEKNLCKTRDLILQYLNSMV